MPIVISQPVAKNGGPESWPTPPHHLMEYNETPGEHLAAGREEYESAVEACLSVGINLRSCRRLLDFGCSNGRVTRWFDATGDKEVWGCDIQIHKLLWAQENLGPPLRFFVNSPEAHLPFADGYFDAIIAQSVFTHLQASHMAWLLELLRVMGVGGHLCITVNDATSLDPSKTEKAPRVIERVFRGISDVVPDLSKVGYLAMNPYDAPGDLAQVYMTEEYIRRLLPRSVKVAHIVPRAYSNVLSLYILERQAA